jgi:tRNA G18 (ribose-2'-O)-methylase SpoU
LRGYFAIGVEGVSKPMNVGSLFRTAHAFGASFVFTIAAAYKREEGNLADTSDAAASVPFYEFADVAQFRLPRGCTLIGVELSPDAVELPSFRHPHCAAYVLGPERGELSLELTRLCQHVVKIPTRFAINLALAGAIVMYDRLLGLGRFPGRPVTPGGPPVKLPEHSFAPPKLRRRLARPATPRD